jgi:acetyl-CoA carboxylase carboxyl transferase subunit alpha
MREHATASSQQAEPVSPAWSRIERARHPQRPYPMDFIERIFTDFSEIHGDRAFGDDEAVACGMARLGADEVLLIANRKGGSTKERVRRNFGMPHPEGYRKALRSMKIAEKFGRPVISLIDLPGAYPGLGAEERGQAEAIARNIRENVPSARAYHFRHQRRRRLGWRSRTCRQRPRADSRECPLLCDHAGILRSHHVARRLQ